MTASPPAVVAAAAGLAAFVLGLWWLARRAITPGDGLDRKHAAFAGVLIAAGVVAWLVGLRLA